MNVTDVDTRNRLFETSREFEFFIRGATCLLQNNDTSSLQSEQMFSLVHYVNHSLEAATYVSQSRVPRDKRFKGDNPGLGCFSRRLIAKGEVFFSVLETEVNCRLDSKGGTWNFDLGDGTALAPLAENDTKDRVFMMNHSSVGNVDVEVGFEEFETRVMSNVFVIKVLVNTEIKPNTEIVFNYFGSSTTSLEPFFKPFKGRRKVSVKKLYMGVGTKNYVATWIKSKCVLSKDPRKKWCETKGFNDLTWNEVCPVFQNGELINSEMVQRACEFLRDVADGRDKVHIGNSNMMPCLITKDPFAPKQILEVNVKSVQKYMEMYPDSSWCKHLDQNRVVFLPINFPIGAHWCCAILWRKKKNYFVRVYNSLESYRRYDEELAKVVTQITGYMDVKYRGIKWKYYKPHDNVQQRQFGMRCALHVVSRVWQVCQQEYLTRVMTLQEYDTIVLFIQNELLRNSDICKNNLIVRESLL